MTHVQTTAELQAHFNEQLSFIAASADSYDRGVEQEAKRIAVSVRVLVHDTKSSKSLLAQLGRKTELFLDTSIEDSPGNLATYSGLVGIVMMQPGPSSYFPLLDSFVTPRPLPFDTWWNGVIFRDDQQRTISRLGLVRALANQDGGAHVDAELGAAYADLSRKNSLGWQETQAGISRAMAGAELAALRQIGHEILKTFIPNYCKTYTPKSGSQVMMAGAEMTSGGPASESTTQTTAAIGQFSAALENGPPYNLHEFGFYPVVGRNEPCPCGSGQKYKRCHGR